MISGFFGEYRWLSNFWPCEIIDKERKRWSSVEHAYQGAKTTDPEIRENIRLLRTPSEAKRAGRALGRNVRKDWEEIKVEVMRRLLQQKFAPGTPLAQKLLDTGDEEIVETNWWGDVFWGVCNEVGENNLGKLLMKIRSELREETPG